MCVERVSLDSSTWADIIPSGANVELAAILGQQVDERDGLITDFIDWTFESELPELAFYYASPYLVDSFVADIPSNWNSLKAYAETALLALDGVVHDAREQLTADKNRISMVMVQALGLIEDVEHGAEKQRCFQLFLGCIAAVHGDEVVGRHIQHLDL